MTARRRTRRRWSWRRFAEGALFVLIALAFTVALHHTHFVRGFERANLSILSLIAGLAGASRDVDVVTITDDDYRNLFSSESPLREDLVRELIRGIADAGAAVIGVDIVTDDWKESCRHNKEIGIPIVWFRDIKVSGGDAIQETPWKEPTVGGSEEELCQGPAALHVIDGVRRNTSLASTSLVMEPSFRSRASSRGCMPTIRPSAAKSLPRPATSAWSGSLFRSSAERAIAATGRRPF